MSNNDSSNVEIRAREGISLYPWMAVWGTPLVRDIGAVLRMIGESTNDPNIFVADLQIEHLCKYYSAVPERERESIRRPEAGEQSLLHFAIRSAVRAMRQREELRIRLGLLALSIENFQFAPPDSITALAVLRHACLLTSADWRGLVQEVCTLSSEKAAGALQGFLARPPDSITLEQMGMREGHDNNGPTIESIRSQSGAIPKQRGVFWGQEPILIFPGGSWM
jgi:hypothetical protein